MPTDPMKRDEATARLSVSQAKADGWQVDETVNPPLAYKGPRFRPAAITTLVTDREAALLAALEEAKNALQRSMPFLETRVHGNTEARELYAQIETALSKLNEAVDVATPEVPQDVRELVIAARIVAFEDQSPDALRRLDKASEAFADRVHWENEPDDK